MRTRFVLLLMVAIVLPGFGVAQSGSTGAGLAGVGAGAALGASAGAQGAATPSSAGGGGNAPVEIQILTMHGLQIIATEIADTVSAAKVQSVLLEDPTSSNQLAFYHAVEGYHSALDAAHQDLQNIFALALGANPVSFFAVAGTAVQTQTASFQNNSDAPLDVGLSAIVGPDANYFSAVELPNCSAVAPGSNCIIQVTFTPPAAIPNDVLHLSSTLTVTYTPSGRAVPVLVSVPLAASVSTPPPQPAKVKPSKILPQIEHDMKSNGKFNEYLSPDEMNREFSNFVPRSSVAQPPTPATTTTNNAPASPPQAPYPLQWTNGVSGDLGSLKGSQTYSPSSLQITTQAFEVLVEAELKKRGVESYTSTSALNLDSAATEMGNDFSDMLKMTNDITKWSATCTKQAGGSPAGGAPAAPSVTVSACMDPTVTTEIATAQQISTGFATLLAQANDGSGSPVIVDVIKGRALSEYLGKAVPSLQLAVTSAGGSSKTNNIFGFTLFYQLAPSYNAGVIATFELRGGDDKLLAAGARNVLYGYKKWNPGHIGSNDIKTMDTHVTDTCTFCSSKR